MPDPIDFSPDHNQYDPFNALNQTQGPTSMQQDSIAVWEAFLTLNDFLTVVGKSKLDLVKELRSIREQNYLYAQQLYQAFAERSADIANVYNAILVQAQKAIDFHQAQQAQQTRINVYNSTSSLNSAKTNLNNAITTFNSTQPPTAASRAALSTAIFTYNNIVGFVVQNYNNEAANFNVLMSGMAEINATRASLGMPPLAFSNAPLSQLPYGQGLTDLGIVSTGNPPIPLVTAPVAIGNITVMPTPPSISQAISLYFPDLAAKIISLLTSAAEQEVLSRALADLNSQLNPFDPTLPPAYIQRTHPTLFSTAEGVTSSVGISGVALSLGLSSKVLERVVSRAIYNAYVVLAGTPMPPRLYDQLQAFVVDLVAKGASAAAAQIVLQQSPNLEEFQVAGSPSPVVSLEKALSFANSIRNIVSSDIVETNLNRILLKNPDLANISLTERQGFTEPLAAIVKFGLLAVALSQVGLSVGAPALAAQVLANLNGASAVKDLFATTEEGALNSILQDPVKQLFLKSTLAQDLVALGLPEAEANTVINGSLNPLFAAENFASVTAFATAFTGQLVNNGVNQSLATQLGQGAVDFLNAEQALPFLDRAFVPGVLPNVLSRLPGRVDLSALAGSLPQVNTEFPVGSINRVTLSKVLSEDLNNPQIVDALRATFDSQPVTVRDFRNAFIADLLAAGVAPEQTQPLANRFAPLFAPLPSNQPLNTYPPQTIYKTSELIEQLSSHIVDRFSPDELDVFTARIKAEQTDRAVINIINGLNEQLRLLREASLEDAVKRTYTDIPRLSAPTVPLFVLRHDINAVISSTIAQYMSPIVQDNLRTADPSKLPTNFKKDQNI